MSVENRGSRDRGPRLGGGYRGRGSVVPPRKKGLLDQKTICTCRRWRLMGNAGRECLGVAKYYERHYVHWPWARRSHVLRQECVMTFRQSLLLFSLRCHSCSHFRRSQTALMLATVTRCLKVLFLNDGYTFRRFPSLCRQRCASQSSVTWSKVSRRDRAYVQFIAVRYSRKAVAVIHSGAVEDWSHSR